MHAVPFIPAIPFKLAKRECFYVDAERFTRISLLLCVPARNQPDSLITRWIHSSVYATQTHTYCRVNSISFENLKSIVIGRVTA